MAHYQVYSSSMADKKDLLSHIRIDTPIDEACALQVSLWSRSSRLLRTQIQRSLILVTLLTVILTLTEYSRISIQKPQVIEPTQLKPSPAEDIWSYRPDSKASKPHQSICKSFLKRLSKINIEGHSRAKHAEALIGMPELFGDKCLTHRERFAPYTDTALDIRSGSRYDVIDREVRDEVIGPVRHLNISSEEWTAALAKKHRLSNENNSSHIPDWKALSHGCGSAIRARKSNNKKTAILLRLFEDHVMTHDEILNLRAMITEMVINQERDDYQVRIMIELRTTKGALMSTKLQEEVLAPMMPREFWGLVVFWSAEVIQAMIPNIDPLVSASFKGMCVLPEQVFSYMHPQYDFIYHWEADIRFLGSYANLFTSLDTYARQQPTDKKLSRYQNWLIRDSKKSEENWKENKHAENGNGVGKDADYLTLNTIKTINGSGWIHQEIKSNYGADVPLRTSIVSTSRMSKALLNAMTQVMLTSNKSLRCEAWPSSVVLHSHLPPSKDQSFDQGLSKSLGIDKSPFKGVFVPHPVYFSESHNPQELEETINRLDYFPYEHVMDSSTYNWYSNYTEVLYDNWRNARGQDSCRLPALLHPVKFVGYS